MMQNIPYLIHKILANNSKTCVFNDTQTMLDRFGFTKKFKVITIAGTNGKGTTVTMLENVLLDNKKTFVTHTSPHLLSFNERIKLNSQNILDDDLEKYLKVILDKTQDFKLSFYQIAFFCSVLSALENHVEFLILEVGIGGRLDSVNSIDTDIATITNISFDHTDMLGNTLDKIGMEKVAIARSSKPLFLGSKMPESIYKYCAKNNIIFINSFENNCQKLNYKDSYCIAYDIAKYLNLKIPHNLEKVRARARFEFIYKNGVTNSYIIVDVAHNIASVEYLFSQIKQEFTLKDIKIKAVFSALASKDIATVVNYANKYIDEWEVLSLADVDSRARDDSKLKTAFKNIEHNFFESVKDCFLNIKINNNELIVIFGSFVLVGEFLKFYAKNNNK